MAAEYFEEGLLVVTPSGHVHALGDYKDLHPRFPGMAVVNYTNAILLPGFIDCHTHFPQLDSIASWGDTLSEWLENYIYPEESSTPTPASPGRVPGSSARPTPPRPLSLNRPLTRAISASLCPRSRAPSLPRVG